MIADDVQLGITMGKFAVETLKVKKVVIFDDQTFYGSSLADAFEKGAKDSGADIFARRYITDKDSDFISILTTLKYEEPDIVFLGGSDTTAGPMIRQIKELGMNVKFMGGDGICTGQLPKLTGNSINEVQVFCAEAGGVERELEARMLRFRASFRAKFGADVQVYAPYVYDSVFAMVQAMFNAKSAEPAKYLSELKVINYKGVTGNIAFDQNGDIKSGALTLMTYKNGRRTNLAVIR